MPNAGERKIRDEHIFTERNSRGTSFRQLGVDHGGLSPGRTRQIFYTEKRRARRRPFTEAWTKIVTGTNRSVTNVWKSRIELPMRAWRNHLTQEDFLYFEENISRLANKNEITAAEASRLRSMVAETKLDVEAIYELIISRRKI
jgi:hypothetical protein